jgi:hypothetical protein
MVPMKTPIRSGFPIAVGGASTGAGSDASVIARIVTQEHRPPERRT